MSTNRSQDGDNSVSEELHLCTGAAEHIAKHLPADFILQLHALLNGAAGDPLRGFQPTRAGADRAVVRRRLARVLEHLPPAELRQALETPDTPWQSCSEALACLNADSLCMLWPSIFRMSREPDFLVAMAMDERPRVAARGRRLLRRSGVWNAPPPPATERDRRRAPALYELAGLLHPKEPESASRPSDDSTHAPSAKRLAKLRAKLQRTEQELEAVRAHSEDRVHDLTARLHDAEAALRQVQADCAARVQQSLIAFRDSVLGITDEIEEIGELAHDPDHEALLEAATKVLDQQARLDERYGTLHDLHERLCRLQSTRDRTRQACSQSVVQHPALRDLVPKLDAAIAEIESDARIRTPSPPEFAPGFAAVVEDALLADEPEAALDEVRNALAMPSVRRALGESGVRDMRERVKRIQDRMSARRFAALALQRPENSSRADLEPREIFDLQRELQHDRNGQPPPRLVVDAWNVAFSGYLNGNPERAGSSARARERLVREARSLQSHFTSVDLVFDGTDPVDTVESIGNLRIVFAARRQEEQNADNYIVDHLARQEKEPGEIWLATGDYGLRYRASKNCQAFVAPEVLVRYLRGAAD